MDVKVDDGRRLAIRNGLYLVCIGLVAEITAFIAEGVVTDDTTLAGRVVRVLSIAAFAIHFIGFIKLSKINEHYQRAKEMSVIAVVILIGVLLFDILTMSHAGAEEILTGTAYVSTIVVILIVSILEIFINKNLLHGNAELAREEGFNELHEKFLRVWRNFIVATIMLVVMSIVMLGAIIALAFGYLAQMNDVLLTGG
ncbi:MAG: hypothetical protein K6F39_04770, partial [Lachnospiraceae bacterium]|nr:hypothetical protein [Lachnospiraceae bacterium]